MNSESSDFSLFRRCSSKSGKASLQSMCYYKKPQNKQTHIELGAWQLSLVIQRTYHTPRQ